MCFRLAAGGVLLLARRLSPDDSTDECLEDLESIGPWLTGAIDASLAQPNAISAEGYRIVSFRRILREAASRGSLRQVVGAFIEALSVWDDVRVRAYVGRRVRRVLRVRLVDVGACVLVLGSRSMRRSCLVTDRWSGCLAPTSIAPACSSIPETR